MDLIEKVRALNLVPITEEIYQEYLMPLEQDDGLDVSRYKYIKFYGDVPIYYSIDYLEQTSIIQLIQMDKRNKEYFQPSLLNRLKLKWQATILKLGWF